jgi:Zn-finger protein
MTYGCGADECLTCYPYQYACADCGARWEKPINNGEVYTCTDCEYINNEREKTLQERADRTNPYLLTTKEEL